MDLNSSRPLRNNLVFIRAGRESKHMSYCADIVGENFDFAVSWYDEGSPADFGMAEGATFVVYGRGGTPIRDAHEAWLRCSATIASYDYVLSMDDDVIADGPTVSRMFDVCRTLRLHLAQPAMAIGPDCFNNHPITAVHHPFSVRYTNFVEPTAMISSRFGLRQLDITVAGAQSPYGIDNTWAHMLPLGSVAIIDETPVVHSRRSNLNGISLTAEGNAASLQNRMRFSNVGRLFMLTYGGFTDEGEFLSMGATPGADSQRVLDLINQSAPGIEASLHQFDPELARTRLGKYLAGNSDFVASSPEHAHVHRLLEAHLQREHVRRFTPRTRLRTSTVTLASGRELPVRVCDDPFSLAIDAVHVDDESRIDVLRRLDESDPLLRSLDSDLAFPYRFLSAFARLDDERSRAVFAALIDMRISSRTVPADAVTDPPQDAHLDPAFVGPGESWRVVDAEVSGGNTLARLEDRFGPVEQAWLFEPRVEGYLQARERFADRPEILLFNMALDTAPSRSASVPDYIQGVRATEVVAGQVTFFTVDAAGSEARALHGARGLIEQNRPVIAVAAHYRDDDYWRLMDEVLTIRADYRVAIRHYGAGAEATTLYFH